MRGKEEVSVRRGKVLAARGESKFGMFRRLPNPSVLSSASAPDSLSRRPFTAMSKPVIVLTGASKSGIHASM
jgi:hypothetical protein